MRLIAQSPVGDFFADPSIDGWDMAFAAVTLIVTWVLSRLAQRGVRRLASRVDGVSADLRDLAGRIVKYFVLLIGIGVALAFLGAPVEPLLAAAIIVGVALVLALRGISDNFAAGIIIQTRRPIHVDDDIESLGHKGVVRELNGRAVVIESVEGAMIHLPNAKVLDSPLVNHSVRPFRRSVVEVRTTVEGAPAGMLETIQAATAASAGVLHDPPPAVFLTAIESEQVVAVVHFWHAPTSAALVTATVIDAVAGQLRRSGRPAAVAVPSPPASQSPASADTAALPRSGPV